MGKIYEALEKSVQEEEQPQPQRQAKKQPKPAKQEQPSPELFEDSVDSNEELVVLGRPGSSIAEHFRFLRSRICRPLRGDNPRTVLITSALQGEGKSFVASNLAATIAQGLDEHVLLVDTDLRNPRIHSVFNLPEKERGLSTHLQDGTPLQELLQKTAIHKLTILPAGFASRNPSELLSSSRMKKFIIEVRHRYPDRYVIFDSSPMELSPETGLVANEVEGIFLVLRRAKTPRESVQSTIEKFRKEQFQGIILNGYDKPAKHYKYAKKGYYNYGYSYHSEHTDTAHDLRT